MAPADATLTRAYKCTQRTAHSTGLRGATQ